jgi:hypothetical protein
VTEPKWWQVVAYSIVVAPVLLAAADIFGSAVGSWWAGAGFAVVAAGLAGASADRVIALYIQDARRVRAKLRRRP